jgi:CHAD domain-containing protein
MMLDDRGGPGQNRTVLTFRLKRSESIAAGVQRITLAQVDAALDFLSTPDHPLDFRVHEARKCFKRLRALFALMEDNVDAELVESARKHVRHAAHALADLRGQAALAETFNGLVKRYPDGLSLLAIGELERALEPSAATTTDTAAGALASAIEALGGAREAARRLNLRGRGFAAVERGFRRTYARARRDFRLAERTPSVDHLHEFRTHQKRHLYQLELLEKVWPKLVRVECKELERLGEHLGEHHDLCLLLPVLANRAGELAGGSGIDLLVERRKRELERKILARGARLFSETPKNRTRRFQGYHAASALRRQKGTPSKSQKDAG